MDSYESIRIKNDLYTDLCIKYGFNVNNFDIQVSFENPLVFAIKKNNIKAFKILIENKAKITTVNLLNDYMSPLAIAIKLHGENSEFVRVMDSMGARNIDYQYQKPYKGYCNTKNLRIRKLPSTDSDILGLLQENEEIEMLGVTPISYKLDNMDFPWVNIRKENINGWVYGGYIKTQELDNQSFNY